MEKIREDLARLFDEMLPEIKKFRRKTYNDLFDHGFEMFKYIVEEISSTLQ